MASWAFLASSSDYCPVGWGGGGEAVGSNDSRVCVFLLTFRTQQCLPIQSKRKAPQDRCVKNLLTRFVAGNISSR